MAFHDQSDQAFALLIGLGENCSDAVRIDSMSDLTQSGPPLTVTATPCPGVEVLLRATSNDISSAAAAYLDHGNTSAVAHLSFLESVDVSFQGTSLAIEPGHAAHQENGRHAGRQGKSLKCVTSRTYCLLFRKC